MSTLAKRPKVRKPRAWAFPQPDEFALANGLQVMLFHRPGQHVVSAGLSLDLPLAAEPDALEGVATLMARTLDAGTSAHPGTAFQDAVEDCGAAFEASVGYSSTHVYVDVPRSHLGAAIALMADAVASPTLADADVDRERALHLAEISQHLANSPQRAAHVFRRAILQRRYRASRLRGGEAATVEKVTGADVRAFHASYVGPVGATLVVVGDLDDAVPGLVEDAFGSWSNPGQQFAEHEYPQPRQRHLYLVDRPGSVQADVRLGHFTIDRADPGWADFQIAVHALGGAFLSRLNRVLREEKGFTYGVRLVNAPLRDGGFTYVQGSFRTEVVAEAVSLLPGLLDVRSAPFTADEVEQARQYLVGVQPLQYATAAGVCNAMMNLLSAGLGPAYVDALRAGFQRVTPESATDVASVLLPPERMTLVVVGDAASLAGPLAEAGWDVRVLDEGEWI